MHASDGPTTNHRARWAAIGAAVAVSLGAGGLGIATATSPDGASAYVSITPCRIMDTRTGDGQVGPQVGPLVGPDAEITVDGWGDVAGDCNLPSGTTGLELNVTATDASQLTNLRFYPEGADTPTASNLNPAPGAPPTPNAVTVSVNTANGKFHVFNRFGSVHVIIDVQGYYTDHNHDDRYYTKAEADDRFARPPEGFVLLQPQDFVAPTPGGWELLVSGILRHNIAASTCTQARLDLPVGATVDRVDFVFRSVAGATVKVHVLAKTNAANDAVSSNTNRLHFANELPSGTSGDYSLLQVEHDPADAAAVAADLPFAATTIEDWAQRLDLCATDTISFTNVKVYFTAP